MRIAHLGAFLARSYENEPTRKRTVYIEGPSGIGKSDVVRQTSEMLAERYKDDEKQPWAGVIDLRLSQCDVTDIRGVPSIVDGRTHWNPPSFFPKPNTRGIFFMDEITSAPPAMQAVAYQLALERVGLPDGWMVVAAGNRQSDRGVTFTMAAPLLNRMTKIDVAPELDGFLMHYAKCGKRPEIMAFLQERTDFLHKFDGKAVGQQFPTPRGWFAASDHLDMAANEEERVEVLQGDVGTEAAANFEAFLRVWETMPKLDSIYADPDSVKVPEKLNVRYCVCMGMAATLTKDNFDNGWKFLQKMPKEMQTLAVRLAFNRDKTLISAKSFVQWATANQDAFQRG